MGKVTLSEAQVKDLVEANKYRVDEATKFISRCIDGRYENSADLPALSIAGADAGGMATLFAAANSFGFEIDPEKSFQVLCSVVGGIQNLRFHTDEHGKPEILMDGCGYVRHKSLDPKAFNVTADQVAFIKKKADEAVKNGAVQVKLKGDHQEAAVLIVKGSYAVYPQYTLQTDHGTRAVQVFEFHQSLVDERKRAIAKELIKQKAVTLFEGCDEEWLYESIVTTVEEHLMEIAKRLAKGLPIFIVSFDKKGNFTLEEAGKVE